MTKQCERLEGCSFFKFYKRDSDDIVNNWIELFCENLEKSEQCERKKYFKKHGEPPKKNMCPTGDILE